MSNKAIADYANIINTGMWRSRSVGFREGQAAERRMILWALAYLCQLPPHEIVVASMTANLLGGRTARAEMVKLTDFWEDSSPRHPLPQDLKNIKLSDYE